MKIKPALLDSLTEDDDPNRIARGQGRWYQSLEQYRNSVIKDVENLLNTRQISLDAVEKNSILHQSLFAYGVKDLTCFAVNTPDGVQSLCLAIEQALSNNEPRMGDVTVKADETNDIHKNPARLKLLISASLVMPEFQSENFVIHADLDTQTSRIDLTPFEERNA